MVEVVVVVTAARGEAFADILLTDFSGTVELVVVGAKSVVVGNTFVSMLVSVAMVWLVTSVIFEAPWKIDNICNIASLFKLGSITDCPPIALPMPSTV